RLEKLKLQGATRRKKLNVALNLILKFKFKVNFIQVGVDKDGVWRLSFTIVSPADLGATLNAFARSIQAGRTADGPRLFVAASPEVSSDEDDQEISMVLEGGNASLSTIVLENGACRLTFFKDTHLSDGELDAFVAAYAVGAFTSDRAAALTPRPRRAWGGFLHSPDASWGFDSDAERDPFSHPFASASQPSSSGRAGGGSSSHGRSSALDRLEALGAVVYREPESGQGEGSAALDWSCLAGYDEVRRDVEDSVLLGLKHPEEYDTVTRKTRARFESNRPRAILFEGPPGTGKTTTARIVASQAKVPMIYIPIESVMSKYYGESESRLSEMLKLCDELGNAIVFLDEIDSLATSREGGSGGSMHEATRRLLSVLLRTLEGFQERTSSILIAATNRKQDLDAALVSRFDMSIAFPLPGEGARREIFGRYARQLDAANLDKLAAEAVGFSGRDIKDVCKHAERRWVSQCLRQRKDSAMGGELEIAAPPMQVYVEALKVRQQQIRRDAPFPLVLGKPRGGF
ncbi:26S proteasome regulatory subunit 8-like, partial [Hondaea fermentalgiana]